jgi:hypothetical protein
MHVTEVAQIAVVKEIVAQAVRAIASTFAGTKN